MSRPTSRRKYKMIINKKFILLYSWHRFLVSVKIILFTRDNYLTHFSVLRRQTTSVNWTIQRKGMLYDELANTRTYMFAIFLRTFDLFSQWVSTVSDFLETKKFFWLSSRMVQLFFHVVTFITFSVYIFVLCNNTHLTYHFLFVQQF